MARRALVIVNRLSRFGSADLSPGLDLLRRAGLTLRVEPTDRPDQIAPLIRRLADRVDLAVVGGGDGTANAAVDALIDTGLPFGLLPVGTANDLARTLGIPLDLEAACAVIARGEPRAIDVGWVNGKHFFNAASVGLSARVAARLTRERKARWGVFAYPRTLLEAWRDHHPFGAVIVCDGRVRRVRSIQITVGNGRHYGGGLTVASDAAIDDGRLHLFSIAPVPLWRLARLAPRLREGRHGEQEEVLLESGAEIELRTRRRLPINTDGEITGRSPARFRVLPRAVTVMSPLVLPTPGEVPDRVSG